MVAKIFCPDKQIDLFPDPCVLKAAMTMAHLYLGSINTNGRNFREKKSCEIYEINFRERQIFVEIYRNDCKLCGSNLREQEMKTSSKLKLTFYFT